LRHSDLRMHALLCAPAPRGCNSQTYPHLAAQRTLAQLACRHRQSHRAPDSPHARRRPTHRCAPSRPRLLTAPTSHPALVSITDITLFLVFSRNNYHMAPAVIIGKLQINSFLVLMNSRRRQDADSDDGVYAWDAETGPNHTGAFRRVSVALDVNPSRNVGDGSLRLSVLDSPVRQNRHTFFLVRPMTVRSSGASHPPAASKSSSGPPRAPLELS
jgi:hypothetical protein